MKYLQVIRKQNPHVFSIMNEVASNFSVNGLIAIGASPSISNTPKEVSDVTFQQKISLFDKKAYLKDRLFYVRLYSYSYIYYTKFKRTRCKRNFTSYAYGN